MDPERRRSLRVRVADDGTNALVRGALAVGVRDISSGRLKLDLGSALDPGAICPLGMPMPREYVLTSSRTNECGIVTYQGRSRISGAALTLVDNRENVCPTFVQLPSVESVETTDSGETRLFAQLAP